MTFERHSRKGCRTINPSALIEDAGGSDEALQKVKGSVPHLIFMDIRMPG